MKFVTLLFLFCYTSLFSVDYDCIVVGTSPFSLLEAIYRAELGNRVLILDEASECGGAWKSVTACGIPHVDLGCHQIGHDNQLRQFLEEYVGCKLVSLDNPLLPYDQPSHCPNGFYFSKGCFELIDNLLKLFQKSSAELLLNHRIDSVLIDPSQTFVTVKTHGKQFTTSKIILTQMSSFEIENLPFHPRSQPSKSKYYHLYLLVQDPTPPRFCYHGGFSIGVSRLMNLTHLVGLTDTGQQLIVIQTYSEQGFSLGETYIRELIAKNLLGPSAYILKSETCLYEQSASYHTPYHQLSPQAQSLFEILNTGHFQSLSVYIPKWKQVLKPYFSRQ